MKKSRATHPLTQQQLADYLLISRGQVAMHEGRERRLPVKAGEKLARLQLALTKNDRMLTANAAMQLQYIAEEEKQALEWEYTEVQHQVHLVTGKLKEARKKYDKAMRMLWAIPVLLENLSSGKEGVYEKKWLQSTEAGLLKKLLVYGTGTQKLLELRKATLEKQLAGIQLLLDAYKTRKIKRQPGKKIDEALSKRGSKKRTSV